MTSLRRLMGLPRFPMRVYVLILALLLVLAYVITGPVHRYFVKLGPALGVFYEPKDFQREKFLKTPERRQE